MLICMTPKEKNKIKHTAHRGSGARCFFPLLLPIFYHYGGKQTTKWQTYPKENTHSWENWVYLALSQHNFILLYLDYSWWTELTMICIYSKPNNGKMRKNGDNDEDDDTKKHIEIFIERNGCARMNVVNLSGVDANDEFNCRALLMVRLNWIVRSENWYYAVVCWREKLPNNSKTSDRIDYFSLCRWIVLRHGYIWLLLLFFIFIVIEHFIYLQFSDCSRSTIISINF